MAKEFLGIAIDSSCCYDQAFIDKNNIIVLPLCISDETRDYFDDNVQITHDSIIAGLKNGKSFKTSATQVGRLIATLEDAFTKYENVLIIPISSELSSQYSQIMNIAKPEFPNLHIINSNTAAIGNEILLKKAVEMKNANAPIAQIISECEKLCRDKIIQFFSVEHVQNLVKGGRGTKAMLTFLRVTKIKPIVRFYGTNHLAGFGRKYEAIVKKMLNKVVSFFKRKKINAEDIENLAILETKGWEEKKRNFFIQQVCAKFNFLKERLFFRLIPNTVLTHTDIGSFGLCLQIK